MVVHVIMASARAAQLRLTLAYVVPIRMRDYAMMPHFALFRIAVESKVATSTS